MEPETNLPAVREEQLQAPSSIQVTPGFQSKDAWELAQRQAKALMSADLVPAQYKNSIGNCIIALDMAYRMGASPLMVMQNLYIVSGRPGWSAQFLIATFNKCGRFAAIRYEWNEDKTECRAWTTEKTNGQRIDGPKISMGMAKEEGWSTKNGSKWKTMPELMLMYRAAAFLIRTYAPEIAMGLHTAEEVEDIVAEVLPAKGIRYANSQMDKAKARVASGEDVADVLKFYPNMVNEQVEELHATPVAA